jgi:putative ABC transport system substrate-binding protein
MAEALLRASKTIPIVVAASSDLVARGLVTSLAKPGGNVTGLKIMSGDLAGKRIELLRNSAAPSASRRSSSSTDTTGFASERRETEAAARTLGVQADVIWVHDRNGLHAAFKKVTRNRYDGLFVFAHPFTVSERREILG